MSPEAQAERARILAILAVYDDAHGRSSHRCGHGSLMAQASDSLRSLLLEVRDDVEAGRSVEQVRAELERRLRG